MIAACDVVISSRLHSMIFSTIAGVPFIDLTHHDKTRYYMKTMDVNWSCPYWNLDVECLKSLAKDMLQQPDNYRKTIQKIKKSHLKVIGETKRHVCLL